MRFPRRAVIIGAGITGLGTAFHLEKQFHDLEITILEISQKAGGLIKSAWEQGYLLEYGPDSVNLDDHNTLNLCKQLGLLDRLLEPASSSREKIILHSDQLIPYPTNLKDIRHSLLSGYTSRLRLYLERFLPRRKDSADESIWHFARRRFGTQFADFFADAAATEFFAGDPKLLSLRCCFRDYAQAEQKFGNVSRGLKKIKQNQSPHNISRLPVFPNMNVYPRTFKEGMQVIPNTLVEKLRPSPCLNIGVQGVVRKSSDSSPPWMVHCEDGKHLPADLVVLTPPAVRQAAMLAELDADLSDGLLTIPYAPLVVIHLGYSNQHLRKPANWSSLIVPQKYKRNLLRVDFPSILFPHCAPEGHLLLRILGGGWHRREMIHWDDGALLLLVRQELRKLFGISKPPVFVNIVRSPVAIPQMMLGHSERMTNINQMAARHPGLFLGGQAFSGPTINDCLADADRLVKQIHDYLSSHQ